MSWPYHPARAELLALSLALLCEDEDQAPRVTITRTRSGRWRLRFDGERARTYRTQRLAFRGANNVVARRLRELTRVASISR